MAGAPGWEFRIDRGGTFADVLGRAPDGVLDVAKIGTQERQIETPGGGSWGDLAGAKAAP